MRILIIGILVTIVAFAAAAQTVTTRSGQKVITKTEGGRTMVRIEAGAFIPELSCALSTEGKDVKILHVMPVSSRPKAYANVDIQANDLILMVNAKPMHSAEAFKKLYEAAAVGDTITLGIKRGEATIMSSFVKMNPADMPKDRRIVIKKSN